MTKPILHPRTNLMIERYIKRPTHGLILNAPEGMGKMYIAKWLASQLGMAVVHIKVPDDKTTIGIDQIRDLYQTTRTGDNLGVIIEDANFMGIDAQNAFLKLLEEPPNNTRFILTTQSEKHLLDTILSRCQVIEILSPNKKTISETVSLDTKDESLLLTTNGLLGDFFNKYTDPSSRSHHDELVLAAKQFYSGTAYERQLYLIEHKFEVTHFKQILSFLAIIVETLLRKDLTPPMRERLIQQVGLIESVSQALLRTNGNPKIHLTRLATRL